MGDNSVTAMTAAVGKAEDPREGSTSSIEDSPEPGHAETYTQENPQQQKRKGGRKPVSLPMHPQSLYLAYHERCSCAPV